MFPVARYNYPESITVRGHPVPIRPRHSIGRGVRVVIWVPRRGINGSADHDWRNTYHKAAAPTPAGVPTPAGTPPSLRLPQLAAALGQSLEYREGEGPTLTPPIRSAGDIQQYLSLSRLHDRLAPIYETVRQLSASLPQDVALIGYVGAPWTVATYMVEGKGGGASDHAIIRQWALRDPDGFQPLIDLLTTAAIQFLERQIEAGAEAVQLFESWAGILPEPYFRRWCVEPVAKIIRSIQAQYPHIPIIAFPRAAGLLYNGYAQATGADCIGLDNAVPLGWAANSLQRELGRCIQGNLDPLMLVIGGQPMATEVERILRATSQGPFVFNLGHGIAKTTLPEHVANLVQHVKAWRP